MKVWGSTGRDRCGVKTGWEGLVIYSFQENSPMGLFDSAFGSTRTGASNLLSPAEAVAAVILVAVAADGYVSDEETLSGWNALSRMQLFRGYSGDVVGRMFDKLGGFLRREGVDALLQLAKSSIPYELAPTVFAIAADLVLADGEVAAEEQAFLEKLYRMLDIPADLAMQIVQVMVIKNKG